MDQILDSLSPEDSSRILCSYINASGILQIVCVTNVSNWYFERVMFPGQRLLFEAPRLAQLEIHTDEIPSAILADKIPCTRLQVGVGTEKSSATKPKHARGDYQYFPILCPIYLEEVMTISAPPRVSTLPVSQQLFSRRDQIPHQQDVLWRIERGVVRTATWSEEGTIIALGYWGPGDIIGYPLSRLAPYQIQCRTSVEMSVLPSDIWATELDAIVLHIQQIEELLSIGHQNPIPLRLWKFLLWLGHKFGRDVEQGRLIDLELTHREIAEAINTTRVTVTRLLQQFELKGILLRHQRQFVLC